MIWVTLFFAVTLTFLAWHAKDEGAGLRAFWLAYAILNGAAAAHMVYSDFPFTWRLAPSDWLDTRSYP